jgi:hypothetical protein
MRVLADAGGPNRYGSVAAKMMPWLPVRLMLRCKFDNLSKMPSIKRPVLICNGNLDTLVDPAMGDRLPAAVPQSPDVGIPCK